MRDLVCVVYSWHVTCWTCDTTRYYWRYYTLQSDVKLHANQIAVVSGDMGDMKYLMNLRINEFYVGLLCFINIMDTNVGHIAHFVVNLI